MVRIRDSRQRRRFVYMGAGRLAAQERRENDALLAPQREMAEPWAKVLEGYILKTTGFEGLFQKTRLQDSEPA